MILLPILVIVPDLVKIMSIVLDPVKIISIVPDPVKMISIVPDLVNSYRHRPYPGKVIGIGSSLRSYPGANQRVYELVEYYITGYSKF